MDKITKLLLTAIALGLWLNVFGHFLRPAPAVAQGDTETLRALIGLRANVSGIELQLSEVASGRCGNKKLC